MQGLYIHIPFCLKKCKYCDFISFCQKEYYFDLYLDRLCDEMKEYANTFCDTVFIGGGTPSILSSEQLYRLLNAVNKYFSLSDNLEFSIEANPKTLDTEKLNTLKQGGVNRISLGVQSFCDDELTRIGRIHNAEEAFRTAELIKKSGIDNFNIDLMLSLPSQNETTIKKTLKTAISLSPMHLSCYSLILEPQTPLYDEYRSGVFKQADDEYDRYLYHLAVDTLKKNGYKQYEISNFSIPGYECRHNLKYWSCDEYIGLGVSAHSYLFGERKYNTSDLSEYLSGKFHSDDIIKLTREDMIGEYIIMRLRLTDGVDNIEFKKRFGEDFYEKYTVIVDKMISLSLMDNKNDKYFLTEKGMDISNSIMCEFL